MIKFNNVSKSYFTKEKEVKILKNISLEIKNDQSVGIIGFTGSGKSTLLRMINGINCITSGNIFVDNVDINKIDYKSLKILRRKIGMIFQNFNLFNSLTVLENVILPLKISRLKLKSEELKKRGKEVLSLVGLLTKENEYPSNLSGGQMQKVAIARALINNPKYLLCDEITASLDNNSALEIIDLLRKIKEERKITIVFVSHQIEVIRKLCDRIIVIEDGKIVEDEDVLEIFFNPKSSSAKKIINHEEIFLKNIKDVNNLYCLKYKNNANEKEILSRMVKNFEINFNILAAQTFNIKGNIIGFLYLKLEGKNINDALNFLRKAKIEVEKYETN